MLTKPIDIGSLLEAGRSSRYLKFLVALTALAVVFDGADIQLLAVAMRLIVYDVSAVTVQTDPARALAVTKPAGVDDQPWEYRRAAARERRGGQLITENVTLSGSQSVGARKNGGRNIIPITGGTLSGRITGKVLPGGADYQKMGNPFTLDARYLWQTDEGDVIIVRNAGPISKLVPTFEVHVDSKYAWLDGSSCRAQSRASLNS
jgi:hypothetical protein